MEEHKFDKLVHMLKRAYEKRGEVPANAFFEQRVLNALKSSPAAEEAEDRFYFRFALAVLSLALVVHITAQYSFVEDRISEYTISSQVDPVDMAEDLDE